MVRWFVIAGALFAAVLSSAVCADGGDVIALTRTDVGTLHLHGRMGPGPDTEFLLDTGSAYVVLSEETRRSLERRGLLTPLRYLRALMANNTSVRAQVFRVSMLTLSNGCIVRDFEAVALPGARKNILGLSALKTVAPFTIHFSPDQLALNCPPTLPVGAAVALVETIPTSGVARLVE